VARIIRAQLAAAVNRTNHPENESKNQTRCKHIFISSNQFICGTKENNWHVLTDAESGAGQ
jgi:hypothetical protein